jgi:hypothetical protein
MADEEDVALSAFKSFCRGTGRPAPQLQEHEIPGPCLASPPTRRSICSGESG